MAGHSQWLRIWNWDAGNKGVDFKDDTPLAVATLSYKLELGLMEKYEKAHGEAESVSLKVDIQKYIKIQHQVRWAVCGPWLLRLKAWVWDWLI